MQIPGNPGSISHTFSFDRALILVNVYVNRFAVYVYDPVFDSTACFYRIPAKTMGTSIPAPGGSVSF